MAIMNWKHDLAPIFYPRSIAMVGASDEPGTWQNHLYTNMRQGGFNGKIFPVHLKKEIVWGIPCDKSIENIEEEVDLAILIIPNHQIESTLEQCARKNVKAAIVLSSGFAEVKGKEGKEMQERIRIVSEKAEIRLIGPNCLGALSCVGGLVCFAGRVPSPVIPGSFGVVSQSGALSSGFIVAALSRGLGMTYLFSSGNEAVLEASDYFHFLINDPQTKVIGAFIEGFKSPEKFLEVSDLALSKGKPIIILKVGRSQKAERTAIAHTGAFPGSDVVQDAVFLQKGIIRVKTIDEMIDTAQILEQRSPVRSGGLTVMATSGGALGLVGDYCEELGIRLPDLSEDVGKEITKILPPFGIVDNPLDVTGQGRQNPEISCRIIDLLMADQDSDIFLFAIASLASLRDPNFQKILEYLAEKGKGVKKNIGVLGMITESFIPEVLEYKQKNPIPTLTGGYCGLLAIRHLIDYNRCLERRKRSMLNGRDEYKYNPQILSILQNLQGKKLSKLDCKSVLEISGIRSPEIEIVYSPSEAIEFAKRVGYPVTLKIDSPTTEFETEKSAGALAFDIRNDTNLLKAYQQILDCKSRSHLENQSKNILIQKMPPPGIEFIVEVLVDRQFGPVIALKMGGLLTEISKTISARVVPVDATDSLEMIETVAGPAAFKGCYGHPPLDINAFTEALLKISKLSVDLGNRLKAMVVNPLVVFSKGEGVCAMDFCISLK